jgi:hypothetical protein
MATSSTIGWQAFEDPGSDRCLSGREEGVGLRRSIAMFEFAILSLSAK